MRTGNRDERELHGSKLLTKPALIDVHNNIAKMLSRNPILKEGEIKKKALASLKRSHSKLLSSWIFG
jgi:hypothetical protein